MAVWSGSFLKFELATLGIVYIWRICAPDTRLSTICSVPCWWSNLDRSLFQCLRERRNPRRSFVCRSTAMNTKMEVLVASNQSRQREANPSLFISRTHGARKSFFGLQVTHLPSPPRQLSHGESPRQWLCVIWLDRCQTCSISIPLKAGDSEWGFPQSFLTELDVCQAKTRKKYELKHQAPFHYPSRFSLRRFQSLLHQA